jgi:hypothetical protein
MHIKFKKKHKKISGQEVTTHFKIEVACADWNGNNTLYL